jgi:hypothetical protein
MDKSGSGILLNQYNSTDILLTYIQSGKYQLQLNVRLYFKTKLLKCI